MELKLEEIISKEQIESILKLHTGERQLLELKLYLLAFKKELKELGVDPANLAWTIYKNNQR